MIFFLFVFAKVPDRKVTVIDIDNVKYLKETTFFSTQELNSQKQFIKQVCVPLNYPHSEEIINEFKIIESLYHPNIIKPVALEIETRHNYLVNSNKQETYKCYKFKLPYYEMNLWEYARQITDKQKLINVLKNVAKDLLNAVNYLHRIKIFHKDIKPDNVLVNDAEDPPQFILIDFEFATSDTFSNDIVGTMYYFAPEMQLQWIKGYSNDKVDVFNIGATIGEVYLSVIYQKWFETNQVINISRFTQKKQSIPYFKGISKNQNEKCFLDFVQRLCDADPNSRPTAEDALRLRFLQEKRPPSVAPDTEHALPANKRIKIATK
eukprot:NODE_311_length_10039_cov_0.864487.p4 type:complete len:321 gc:universal NODE_311_length_10039_cov_0.864487:7455-6493(-)